MSSAPRGIPISEIEAYLKQYLPAEVYEDGSIAICQIDQIDGKAAFDNDDQGERVILFDFRLCIEIVIAGAGKKILFDSITHESHGPP